MPNLEAVNAPAHRPDSWAVNATQCGARYKAVAHAEPALLCQVLNFFAMQYLVPRDVNVAREEDLLMIDIAVDGLSWHRAQVIGEKMRNLIDVCSVELTQFDSVNLLQPHVALAAG
jgi:hypothetical protein